MYGKAHLHILWEKCWKPKKKEKKYHKQPDKKTAFKGAAVIWTADFSADTVKAQKRNKAVCLLMNTL